MQANHNKYLAPGPFPGGSRYNAFGPFLKAKFGCRVWKISVDGGFTCPNRDGTISVGGCTYCNNDSFRPATATSLRPISEQVEQGIDYLRRRYRAEKFIVYFQSFTSTYAPLEALVPLYEAAIARADVVGLSLGSRPDCVDEAKIAFLEKLARTHFVTLEFGLESIYDKTLARINRGHNYQCWLDAMNCARNRGIWLGAHLILGFPWETRDEILAMAEAISDRGLDFLKLHHLHVVQNTAMARDYQEQPFPLLGFEEYTDLVVDFLERLNPAIRVERLFGIAPGKQLLGPIWGKSKAEIQRRIENKLARRNSYQGFRYKSQVLPLSG